MMNEPDRAARIIESQVVGDGGTRDTALRGLAVEVRTMGSSRQAILEWVKSRGQKGQIDSDTVSAILAAIIDGEEAG